MLKIRSELRDKSELRTQYQNLVMNVKLNH